MIKTLRPFWNVVHDMMTHYISGYQAEILVWVFIPYKYTRFKTFSNSPSFYLKRLIHGKEKKSHCLYERRGVLSLQQNDGETQLSFEGLRCSWATVTGRDAMMLLASLIGPCFGHTLHTFFSSQCQWLYKNTTKVGLYHYVYRVQAWPFQSIFSMNHAFNEHCDSN